MNSCMMFVFSIFIFFGSLLGSVTRIICILLDNELGNSFLTSTEKLINLNTTGAHDKFNVLAVYHYINVTCDYINLY